MSTNEEVDLRHTRHMDKWLKDQLDDAVNHPKHYTAHPSGIECITVVEHFCFNLGNAVKYIWRAGLKSASPLEDLKKAEWYLKREIERLEKKP